MYFNSTQFFTYVIIVVYAVYHWIVLEGLMVDSNHLMNPHDDKYRLSIKEFNANTLSRITDALIMVYAPFFNIWSSKAKAVW